MARNMPKGVHVAPLFPRFVGWLIDASVPAVLGALLWMLTPRVESASALLVVTISVVLLQLGWGLLLWWGYGTRGAGVGFSVVRLQLVGINDGRPIGWWRYFLRQLVFAALVATVVGGVFLVIFLIIDPRHQGWHDKAGRAVAIRARSQGKARVAGKTVAAHRRTPSTTVALPPHLVAKAFDGTASVDGSAQDPAEIARQAAAFGGGQPGPYGQPGHYAQPAAVSPPGSPGWRPPGAPGQAGPAGEHQTGRNTPPAEPRQAAQRVPTASAAPSWQHPATPSPDLGETQVRARRVDNDDPDGGTHLVSRPAGRTRAGNEGWFIVLDDGRHIDVNGLVVVGRKPTQPVGRGDATLVPAGEGGHAVSKNHLQVGTDARGIWVSDTGSTNGTAVVNLRGDLEPCQPGVQVRAREGQVVSFGDRSLTVRRKPAF